MDGRTYEMKLTTYCGSIVKLLILGLIGLTTINISDGAAQEKKDTLEITIKKAEQGDASAQYSLGKKYYFGKVLNRTLKRPPNGMRKPPRMVRVQHSI